MFALEGAFGGYVFQFSGFLGEEITLNLEILKPSEAQTSEMGREAEL